MKDNAFTTEVSFIHHGLEAQEIIDTFQSDHSVFRVCMVVDQKNGSLVSVKEEFVQKKDWIVIELDPQHNLIADMAAELSNREEASQIFEEAEINLSFLELGADIYGVPPVTDTCVALGRMLAALTKENKKILVLIDEIVSNENMHIFVSQFQIFMRRKYNVFLFMAGSRENIQELQDVKSLTFLYRAPKVVLRS